MAHWQPISQIRYGLYFLISSWAVVVPSKKRPRGQNWHQEDQKPVNLRHAQATNSVQQRLQTAKLHRSRGLAVVADVKIYLTADPPVVDIRTPTAGLIVADVKTPTVGLPRPNAAPVCRGPYQKQRI